MRNVNKENRTVKDVIEYLKANSCSNEVELNTDLQSLSPFEAFNAFLNWNGIIGYTTKIWNAYQDCNREFADHAIEPEYHKEFNCEAIKAEEEALKEKGERVKAKFRDIFTEDKDERDERQAKRG